MELTCRDVGNYYYYSAYLQNGNYCPPLIEEQNRLRKKIEDIELSNLSEENKIKIKNELPELKKKFDYLSEQFRISSTSQLTNEQNKSTYG
jgi:predicted nuclease with TOPRIM domain